MRMLPRWEDCRRCGRRERRLAVYTPSWGPHVRVVVLGVRASWTSQVAGSPDAQVARLVRALRERLGLTDEECVGDALVACGAGDNIVVDHVAACSARFTSQAAQPRLVVLAGPRAAALASDAGLVDGGHWTPFGVASISAITADVPIDDVVKRAAAALGVAAVPVQVLDRTRLVKLAGQLHRWLGEHRGQHKRVLVQAESDEGSDMPPFKGPVRVEDVAEHLAGNAVVTPKGSAGPWPFVVVRVPRHSAIQAATADAMVDAVTAAMPGSFVLNNKHTGETQFYVNVPDGMSYGQGALLLRAYLSAQGLRWRLEGAGPRSALAELASVPAEPLALPFGAGWAHDGHPLDVQLGEFLQWLGSRDVRAFVHAESVVENHYKLGHRWTPTKRRRLRDALLAEELSFARERVPASWANKLGGRWPQIASQLSPAATRIAGLGLRHDGVRDRWVRVLVNELVDLVDRPRVEELMRLWLVGHTHVDELVVSSIETVASVVKNIIARRYKTLRGVPERFWTIIEPRVRVSWNKYQAAHIGKKSAAKYHYNVIARTAFFIARDIYRHRGREMVIASPNFERFTGSNTARVVRSILVDRGWLILTRESAQGRRSRTFGLTADLWPARPGESVLFLPP